MVAELPGIMAEPSLSLAKGMMSSLKKYGYRIFCFFMVPMFLSISAIILEIQNIVNVLSVKSSNRLAGLILTMILFLLLKFLVLNKYKNAQSSAAAKMTIMFLLEKSETFRSNFFKDFGAKTLKKNSISELTEQAISNINSTFKPENYLNFTIWLLVLNTLFFFSSLCLLGYWAYYVFGSIISANLTGPVIYLVMIPFVLPIVMALVSIAIVEKQEITAEERPLVVEVVLSNKESFIGVPSFEDEKVVRLERPHGGGPALPHNLSFHWETCEIP